MEKDDRMQNYLLENNITVLKEAKNWSYLLEDEDKFSQLGYKVMQSVKKEGLLKSTKIRHNGQIKLIYFTENYQNLTTILANIPPNEVWNVLGRLLTEILKIKENGFLSCVNIEISPERIYVDADTYEPHLIYLPLVEGNSVTLEDDFIVTLKKNLLLALQMANNAVVRERENDLLQILNGSTNDLTSILKNIMHRTNGGKRKPEHPSANKSYAIELVSKDPRLPIRYVVEKKHVSIGRRKDNDLVIDITKKISRNHCSIHQKDGKYYLIDEESTSGTFLNNKKCIALEEYPLKEGDTIQLPNVLLVVKKSI